MLRLAFDFIITWRETRTRPNAYSLASCHTHVYASSYSLPWDSACEHYIFGMRRILI